MTDIVERLRAGHDALDLRGEAADQIERLRAKSGEWITLEIERDKDKAEIKRLEAENERLLDENELLRDEKGCRILDMQDEIERLRALNAELVEALRIAHMALELRGPGFPLAEITAAIAKAEGKS